MKSLCVTRCVWLACVGATLALAGCFEPSGLSSSSEIYEAFAARDAGNTAGTSAGTGGTGGTSGTGGSDAAVSPMGGTGGAIEGGAQDPCGDVLEDLIKPRCASMFCHATAAGNALDFEATGLPGRLVDVQGSTLCDQYVYIDTASPEDSLIYSKLSSPAPCGTPMPLTGNPLTAEEKACVLEYVQEVIAEQ